jgi:hypothetical protein
MVKQPGIVRLAMEAIAARRLLITPALGQGGNTGEDVIDDGAVAYHGAHQGTPFGLQTLQQAFQPRSIQHRLPRYRHHPSLPQTLRDAILVFFRTARLDSNQSERIDGGPSKIKVQVTYG